MDNVEAIKMLSKVEFYDDVVGAKSSIPLKNIALALDYPSDETVFCVSCSCKKKEDVPFYKEKIEKEFSSLTAHQNGTFFDITNKKCSKGNSIDILRKQYEKPFVFGIGDNYNDITLLDSADVSFTFTYSDDEVKKHADYIVNNIKEAIDIALKIISESE